MSTINDFETSIKPTWCPGCGNFGIFIALKQALVQLGISTNEVAIVFDIGCSGNMADKIKSYGFKSLHGRAIPVACGIKVANPKLHVIAIGGDGGLMEEGLNHAIWSARSNYGINVILHNNSVFGLTTGQPTTLTSKGTLSKMAPKGVIESNLNPIQMMLTSGANYLSRGFAGDVVHLTEQIKLMLQYKGFSFLEVLQPCVTYNKINTYDWYRERVHKLEQEYISNDKELAYKTADTSKEQFALGVIYKNDEAVPYSEALESRKSIQTTTVEEVKNYSIEKALEEYS